MIEWKKRWHPRGEAGAGPLKRGLGVGFGTWGGAGHASQCRTRDSRGRLGGSGLGSQDLGTGTRTIISMVAAESLGLPVQAVKLNIGDNRYPRSGSSGGVHHRRRRSSSTRKSTLNALEKLFELVAPALGAPAGELEAVGGKIQVKATRQESHLARGVSETRRQDHLRDGRQRPQASAQGRSEHGRRRRRADSRRRGRCRDRRRETEKAGGGS